MQERINLRERLVQQLRDSIAQQQKQRRIKQEENLIYTAQDVYPVTRDIPGIEIEYLSLEDYITALQQIPIVFSVKVLFDDRPEEVFIRIEYVENLRSLPAELLTNSNYQLTLFTNKYRIEGCNRINITYIQKEVIE